MLDEQEKSIVRELIKNPRISDNKIGKNTGIPIISVNRKRKKLEQKGFLSYFAHLDNSSEGISTHPARQFYILKFKIGITKKDFINKFYLSGKGKLVLWEQIFMSMIGDSDGHLLWFGIIQGSKDKEISEFFNGILVPFFYDLFGNDSVVENKAFRLTKTINLFHNYLPGVNYENGKIVNDWPEEVMFVI